MKVMVIVKASPSSEAGKLPSQELLQSMGQFNEDLVNAGIMEFGEGLKPSRDGYRVKFDGTARTINAGPFAETNELIAGFWIWNVRSMEEALEWVKKCPNPMEEASEIEVRPFYEMDDFATVDTDGAVREQEDALRRKMALQKSSLNNYLFYGGRCEEALNFYSQHLGAKVQLLLRFSEMPAEVPNDMVPEGSENKVMHAEFTVGGVTVFASDGCNDAESFGGFRLSLTLPTEELVQRTFAALAEGGKIDSPLEKTFFSPLYGQVTDQFGVGWMVMIDESNA